MFVRSLAYSCRSSCSSGEHCGGAEARLWDVESESDDVIAVTCEERRRDLEVGDVETRGIIRGNLCNVKISAILAHWPI
jgi:hypothetical protein